MARFDPAAVLASRPALTALGRLAEQLRAAGYNNRPLPAAYPGAAASRLALGHAVERCDWPDDDSRALVAAGAADLTASALTLRFLLFAAGRTLVVVPKDGGYDSERVYFGRDSLWLAELARRIGPPRGALADLGSGAGTVAALLADRFDPVVATDILPRTAASAALTLALNRRTDGRAAGGAVVADVAGGLRAGAFDLVTANPPWVPDRQPDASGRHRVFAEGGRTGFELPRRFVAEALTLLRPGGVAVTLLLDVTWRDGRRPLHALARGLRRLGHDVAIVDTDAERCWPDLAPDLLGRFPGMAAVRHVALLVAAGRPLSAAAPSWRGSTSSPTAGRW